MSENGDFTKTEAGRVLLAILDQAERDLKDSYRALVAETALVQDLLAGRADRDDRSTCARVREIRRLMRFWSDLRRFYVSPASESSFPSTCIALGQDPREKRESLRSYLFLPWSGYQARNAAADFLRRRRRGRKCASRR